MDENKQISWIAPEFIQYPKNKMWYGVVAGAGFLLVAYFLYQKDFLTAVLFALMFLMLVFFAREKPRQINITLSGLGVKLNEQVLPYQQIKNFWIVYEPPQVKTVNFETSAYLNRFVTLQLVDQDPVAVRDFLLRFLIEDLDRQERVSDAISRKMKF